MRIIGSPDPYGKQTDGMGGATSSTSKTVIVSKSLQAGHDVDYLFGQVAIDKPMVDWSGNCGNLSSAVGPFALAQGLVAANRIPENGVAEVRIWQANIHKTIVAKVPITNRRVQETGGFELDGVTFPAAEVQVEFLDPAGSGSMFPTGNIVDTLSVPEVGEFEATLIDAGIPTIFVRAEDIGLCGTEMQAEINHHPRVLKRLEKIRANGALKMGLIDGLEEAETRQHTPKVAWAAGPLSYIASSGKEVSIDDVDLVVRAMSMGQLHHAMMGTAAVAISIASAIPGTIINLVAGGGERTGVRFGHPSGILKVGGQAIQKNGQWYAKKATMSRSARVLMEGVVRVPNLRLD